MNQPSWFRRRSKSWASWLPLLAALGVVAAGNAAESSLPFSRPPTSPSQPAAANETQFQNPNPSSQTNASLDFAVHPVLREMPRFLPLSSSPPSTRATEFPISTSALTLRPHPGPDPILATNIPTPHPSFEVNDTPRNDELVLQVSDRWLSTLPITRQSAIDDFVRSLPTSADPPTDDNLLRQAGEILFPEPASVRLGKLEVGGGIITAIKRHNPLALLNPFSIFSISW